MREVVVNTMDWCSYCQQIGHHYHNCNLGIHESCQYIEATKLLYYLVNERWLVLNEIEALEEVDTVQEPVWNYYHDLKTLHSWIHDDLLRRSIFFLRLLYQQLQTMTHYLPLRQTQNNTNTLTQTLEGIMEMFDSVKHIRPENLHNVVVPHMFLPLVASRESVFLDTCVQIQGYFVSIVLPTVPTMSHIVVVESKQTTVSEDVCGICLSNVSFVQTQCGHMFCQCIQTYLLKYNRACPLCRSEVKQLSLFDKRSYDCMKLMNEMVPSSILLFPGTTTTTTTIL